MLERESGKSNSQIKNDELIAVRDIIKTELNDT